MRLRPKTRKHDILGHRIRQKSPFRRRATSTLAGLIAVNILVWAWALIAFHTQPLMLGVALMAWGFGLRHAVDADHIAAIDNVTRKLMQDGQRPVTVGLFFAIGHSGLVILVTLAIAVLAIALQGQFESWRAVGGTISTSVSALFLFLIAAINIGILRNLWQAFRRMRQGGLCRTEDLDTLLDGRGVTARLFRPLFRLVRSPIWMLPLGFLFGLGFDTATEVSLLAMSASQASHGLPIWDVMILPILFAAGMSLVDTSDGLLMVGAYEWAFIRPFRKLYYNLTITLVSVIVALLIAGIETLAFIGNRLGANGALWRLFEGLGEHFNTLGFVIIGVFITAWVVSYMIYRIKGFDELDRQPVPADNHIRLRDEA